MELRGDLPDLRCGECPQLQKGGGDTWCALRDSRIDSPGTTLCANHPDAGDRRIRVPVGPILSWTDGPVRVLQPSPDSTKIRSELIVYVDESDKRSVADLTLREEVALWQLVEWRERRAFVVRDKIRGEPRLPGARAESGESATDPEEASPLPVGTFRPAARRARVVTWLLGIGVAASVALIVSNQLQIELLERASFGIISLEEAEANDLRHSVITGVYAVVRLATVVAFLMWVYRAYANVRAMSGRKVDASPAWAVVCWFIPVANLVMPYRVVAEIAEKSSGPEHPPMKTLVRGWWLAFVAVGVASWFGNRAVRGDNAVEQLINASRGDQLTDLLGIVAAVLAILVVRGIEQRQASRPDIPATFD